jgi:hypothetical protein
MRRRIVRAISPMAGAAFASAIVTATVLAFTSGHDEPVDGRRSADLPLLESVPPALAAAVPAFKRPQLPSDRIPGGDPVAALDRLNDRQSGENPRLSRRVATGPRGSAYVWPMTGGVCYASPGPSGCVTMSLLTRHGAVLGTTRREGAPTMGVFGIAVEGIDRIVFTRADGTRKSVRVADGAVFKDVPADVVEASWTKPSGSRGSQPLAV